MTTSSKSFLEDAVGPANVEAAEILFRSKERAVVLRDEQGSFVVVGGEAARHLPVESVAEGGTMAELEESFKSFAPADAGVPRAVVECFWRTYGSKIPERATVFSCHRELDPGEVRTSLNERVSRWPSPARAFLFFVNLHPEANWAHPCRYAFVSKDGEAVWYDAEWPPVASITLRSQCRP